MPELYIDESNYQYWTGAGNTSVQFDGSDRILNFQPPAQPYGEMKFADENGNLYWAAKPFEDMMPLIPRDEWVDRIKQKDANNDWLKVTCESVSIPVKDQDGLGYCFTKDTQISLLDGTEKTLEELMDYEGQIWVYSYDHKTKRVVPGKASTPFKTREQVEILKVTLDNGKQVRCTYDHPWLMRDGTYRRADKLKSGDSLMPLYRRLSTAKEGKGRVGYEMVLDPDNGWEFTHVRAAELSRLAVNYSHKRLEKAKKTTRHVIRHHSNFNKRDNRPNNLVWIKYWDHFSFHRETISEFNKTPIQRKRASDRMKALHLDSVYAAKRDKAVGSTMQRLWQENKEEWSKASAERMKKLNQDPAFQLVSIAASSKSMFLKHQNPEFVGRRDKRNNTPVICPECGQVCGNVGGLGIHTKQKHQEQESVLCDCGRFFNSTRGFDIHKRYCDNLVVNHKILSVEPDGIEDVYDITVQKYHNFALSAGVFVHNCHAYGTVSVEEILLAIATGKYVGLSAESVGGIVTGWRNQGADPMDDLAVAIRNGACEESYMDRPHSLNPSRWKEGWQQNALTHRIAEFWDLRVPGKVFDAVMTCYLYNFPIGLGYGWWSHFIHGGFRARWNAIKRCFDIEERNSWGKNYGENGYFWLPEGTGRGQGTPDWAFAGRALLA